MSWKGGKASSCSVGACLYMSCSRAQISIGVSIVVRRFVLLREYHRG